MKKYLNQLDRILIKNINCKLLTYREMQLFDMAFKVSNEQSVIDLKASFNKLNRNLANETKRFELENEFEDIAVNLNLKIEVDFVSFTGSLEDAINSLPDTSIMDKICSKISCFNEYFQLKCNPEDGFVCSHVCDIKERMYCKNDATCLPSYDQNYKPNCA